jgi:ubiquinone/menaquinone biosynthesis C-methylase UbiE
MFLSEKSRIGGKASLRKTRAMRDVSKYFLHKGKSMDESSKKIPPRITRQRDRVHDQVLKSVAISVQDLQPKRVLDVGTGYGMNLAFLARRFGKCSRIWSVDASPEVVHEVKKRMRTHEYSRHVILKQANAEQLPFKGDYFELIVSLFSLHHLSNPKRGLVEMGRTLSHEGKMIIADWRPQAAKPLMLHSREDIPSPTFVVKELKRLGHHTRIHVRRYWYLIESTKHA